jgi:hypothetical protein
LLDVRFTAERDMNRGERYVCFVPKADFGASDI